jgi:putative protease
MADEKEVGKVDHFYDKISVGVIELSGSLKVGDKIHIQGAHDDFEQEVESMQLDHKDVKSGKKGQAIAIKVSQPVHKNDKVLLAK